MFPIICSPITGVYKNSISFSEAAQYRVEYITPSKYDNMIETMNVEELSFADALIRILGLNQENCRMFDEVHDRNSNLIGSLLKIYSSASDVENDANPIAQYQMSATFDRKNKITGYQVKRV